MKRFHITYYLMRESENGPLLSGITIEADNMILAINRAIVEHSIPEEEIKYILEL